MCLCVNKHMHNRPVHLFCIDMKFSNSAGGANIISA